MITAETTREHELAHRLKNHLGLIVTFCELLLESTDASDRRRQDVLMIQQAANEALAIVPQLGGKRS